MTDNQPISDLALRALAAFIAEGRPDWQAPGILAEFRRCREDFDPWQLAQAMIRRASDPANLTPVLQGFDVGVTVGCRRHPGAAVRTDGMCGVCFAEAHAVESEARRGDPEADPHPLETALARLGVRGG